jgi:hypothetical protein
MTLTTKQRVSARKHAGLRHNDNRPIEVIPESNLPPRLVGRGYFWKSPDGEEVTMNPRDPRWEYIRSTRRITVGANWFN